MDVKELDSVRIDKWLWAVRICKTRQVAMDLCKRQNVRIDGQYCKPSREVKIGQLVTVKKEGIDWQYRVLKCIDKRVGAKVAVDCKEDETSQEDKKKIQVIRQQWVPRRPKGMGRPTKKDRRDYEKLHEYD